ncbi:MAG: histidine kinase dimerization/phospho-acceptor domain-containing protein [Terracidiphilus sp.]|jgi:signal transduction histidine kinase
MPDYYHVPAFVLIALLLSAFGYLYRRFRDTRTLLWFLGFLFALVRMLLIYKLGPWDFSDGTHPWVLAIGQTSIQISSALFLASLSPLRFRIGRFKVLYVFPYAIPLVIYSILFEGVFRGITPAGALFLIFPALGAISLVAACFWGAARGSLPSWLGISACAVLGSAALWICFTQGAGWPLTFVECANHVMAILLVIFVFRRFTPGVVLSVLGFAAWSLSILEMFPSITQQPAVILNLVRFIVMGKVVAALGMILLALEDEVNVNMAAQERERRVRRELEAYANLVLSRRRVEDFDRQGAEICQIVAANSRFSQAALLLLLENTGRYRLAGAAGLDAATATALDAMAARIPVAGFLAPGSAPSVVEHSETLNLNLEPWLTPGDDLKRLRFTSVMAVPLTGRSAVEGVLLLSGLRNVREPLRADDLLPAETLTARMQAVRSQTRMLEKLIDSEKFAGLGQLAGNVTQQLNNPLTVILGYASLLDETSALDPHERKGVEAILTEARRMRSTLESLSRISRPQGDQLAAVSVTELLADMEELHRPEFLQRSIEFCLSIAPSLPRVLCHPQQLRQAVLHCLQFAIDAVERQSPAPDATKTIRLEATSEGKLVQILIAHSGPGFLQPERAFDPFVPSQATGETAGLGLSLCATILRDHNGRASAVNLEPRGAAIILELRAA